MSTEFQWVAFAVVLIVSAARIDRLLLFDDFPLTKGPREAFMEWCEAHPRFVSLQPLGYCGWCMAFWVVLVLMVWADLAGVLNGHPAFGWSGDLSIPLWWIANGTMAATYAAGWVMANDGDTSGDS